MIKVKYGFLNLNSTEANYGGSIINHYQIFKSAISHNLKHAKECDICIFLSDKHDYFKSLRNIDPLIFDRQYESIEYYDHFKIPESIKTELSKVIDFNGDKLVYNGRRTWMSNNRDYAITVGILAKQSHSKAHFWCEGFGFNAGGDIELDTSIKSLVRKAVIVVLNKNNDDTWIAESIEECFV